MELITYKQACELLDVKYVTIKDAVLYSKLTKCAVKGTYLLKEQVLLFKHKRISLNALTVEEKHSWEEYKEIAENSIRLELEIAKKSQSDTLAAVMANQEKLKGKLELVKETNKVLENCLKLVRELAIDTKTDIPQEVISTHP